MDLLEIWRSWWTEWTREKSLGERGEEAAARFLERLGYTVVARSQRTKLSEIDLIAVEGETIVFVEVKTRASDDRSAPSEAVDRDKQRRLARAAMVYLKRHNLLEYAARFDVISIVWPAGSSAPEIEHIPSAFEPPDKGQLYS